MQQRHAGEAATWKRAVAAITIALAIAGSALTTDAVLSASSAYAGYWMRSTCINPNGTASSSEGWSTVSGGGVSYGSSNSTACGPMSATLSSATAAPVGAFEGLVYTPPAGSALAGGLVGVNLLADGGGYNASGVAAVYTPNFAYDGGNVVVQCASGLGPCANGTNNYVGAVPLPSNRVGSLYIVASCGGNAGYACNANASQGAWSRVLVSYANLLLASTNTPAATDFRGSLLAPGAHGTASLSFFASVPSGPGLYRVGVLVDGRAVYDGVPNTNAGKCVPVGSDGSALIFASQQPCLLAQRVDLTVRTTGLRDGEHELRIMLSDAAQNTQTVLRQTISTDNRTTTSSTLMSDAPKAPGGAHSEPADPVYALVLDRPTQHFVRGVRRGWRRSAIKLSGTLRTTLGIPAPGVPLTLLAENADEADSTVVAQATSDASGHWTLTAPRGPSRTLTIAYGAHPMSSGPGVVTIRQTVTPAVSLTVSAPGHGRLRFLGRVRIKPLGAPRPLVVIQARNGGHWQAVGEPVRVDEHGVYRLTFTVTDRRGIGRSYAFRAVAPATRLAGTGISPIRRKVAR